MSPLGYIAVGFCLPFALGTAALAGLLARDAWERWQDDRRQRPPKSLLERVARARDEALEDALTAEDLEHPDQWERELGTEADA